MNKAKSSKTGPEESVAEKPPVSLPKKIPFTKPDQSFKPKTFFVKQISFHGTQHRG